MLHNLDIVGLLNWTFHAEVFYLMVFFWVDFEQKLTIKSINFGRRGYFFRIEGCSSVFYIVYISILRFGSSYY